MAWPRAVGSRLLFSFCLTRVCKNQTERVIVNAILLFIAVVLSIPIGAAAADQDVGVKYGRPGQPVQLVVGYQPYFTQAWSSMVLRGRRLHEKYLPSGSRVTFEMGIRGAGVITEALQTGDQQIGYLGSAPAVRVIAADRGASLRLVAVSGLGRDQCNILLVRANAPQFDSYAQVLDWLAGKRMAQPRGTCADLFGFGLIGHRGRPPASILNQSIDVIPRGFQRGGLDAAVVWEPMASQLIVAGLARRAASGITVGESDGAFIVMRSDLISARPDIVRAWLQAELDAQLFLADPANAAEVLRIAADQTYGIEPRALRQSLYAAYPASVGGTGVRLELPFGFTDQAVQLLNGTAVKLAALGQIPSPELPPGSIVKGITEALLAERHLRAPVGQVNATSKALNGPPHATVE